MTTSTLRLVPALLLVACATAPATVKDDLSSANTVRGGPRPLWVTQKDPQHASSLVGVGVTEVGSNASLQKTLSIADASARGEIAKILKVTVASEVKSFLSSSTSEGDKQVLQSTASEVVDSFALQGCEISDHWRDEKANVMYSLALLDREKAGPRLLAQVQDAQLAAEAYRNKGDEALATDPSAALKHYLRARVEAGRGVQAVLLYRVVTQKEIGFPPDAGIDARLVPLLDRISLGVVQGDRQRGVSGQPLPKPIVFAAAFQTGASSTPMPGIPLVVTFPGGKAAPAATTKGNGRASVQVDDAGPLEGAGKLTARIDWAGLVKESGAEDGTAPRWLRSLPGREATAQIVKRALSTLRIAIRIVESVEGGSPPKDGVLQTALSSAFRDAGVEVKDSAALVERAGGEKGLVALGDGELREKGRDFADVLVVGTVSTSASALNGLAGATFHEAHGAIRAIDLGGERVLHSIDSKEKA